MLGLGHGSTGPFILRGVYYQDLSPPLVPRYWRRSSRSCTQGWMRRTNLSVYPVLIRKWFGELFGHLDYFLWSNMLPRWGCAGTRHIWRIEPWNRSSITDAVVFHTKMLFIWFITWEAPRPLGTLDLHQHIWAMPTPSVPANQRLEHCPQNLQRKAQLLLRNFFRGTKKILPFNFNPWKYKINDCKLSLQF